MLAVDAGVPIVPVVIRGTRSIMPKHRLLIRRAGVTLDILEPVETSGYTRKTKDDLVRKIRDILIRENQATEGGETAC